MAVSPADEFNSEFGLTMSGADNSRWARLKPQESPTALEIESLAAGPEEPKRHEVLASRVEPRVGRIPSDPWCAAFHPDRVPLSDTLLVELNGDTFKPSERADYGADPRRVGIMVESIRSSAVEAAGEPGRRDAS